jgi:hypothetical protein
MITFAGIRALAIWVLGVEFLWQAIDDAMNAISDDAFPKIDNEPEF